jgi:hypothetical protein
MPDAPEDRDRGGRDDELASHPGRHRPRDELDPELLKLPRKGVRIGWLLALAVVVLCAFLLFELRRDLVYSRAGDQPVALDAAERALDADPNSFVEMEAVPDRAYFARVRLGRSGEGQRLAPVLGTNARVWILLPGSPWGEPATYREVYRGRLQPLDDMPFAEALREWMRAQPPIPRPVAAASLRRALAGAPLSTLADDVITPSADTQVTVAEVVKGSARITVTATSDHPDEAHWRAALVREGLLEQDVGPESATYESWTYRVRAPKGVEAIAARLVAAKLFAAEAHPDSRRHVAEWKGLELYGGAEGGIMAGLDEVPWSDVTEVTVAVKSAIPEDARVLLTDQRPADYWYVLPLSLVLAAFVLLFSWAFFRARTSAHSSDASSLK